MSDTLPMTDLAMTKLCAEAMGYDVYIVSDFTGRERWMHRVNSQTYEPLTDNAEAMALVKRWTAECLDAMGKEYRCGRTNGRDYNRAIVECVARMQRAKP